MTNQIFIFSHIRKCAGSTIINNIKMNFNENEYIHIHLDDPDEKKGNWWRSRNEEITYNNLDKCINLLTNEKKNNIRFIVGHDVYYGIHNNFNKIPKYFTFFRKPIDRIISLYNYSRKELDKALNEQKKIPNWLLSMRTASGKILSFEEWVKGLPANFNKMLEHFVFSFQRKDCNDDMTNDHLNEAKTILDNFFFIGFTDKPKDFKFIYNELDIKNIKDDANVTRRNYIKKEELKECLNILYPKIILDIELYHYALELKSKKKIEKRPFFLFEKK